MLGLKQDIDEKANYSEESPTLHVLEKGVRINFFIKKMLKIYERKSRLDLLWMMLILLKYFIRL
jgi:hypothetical protein